MPRYIDAEPLYERTAEWEASALSKIEELNRMPREEMTDEERAEWRRWMAILGERSAFKHDVADEPTADVVERKRGKWIPKEDRAKQEVFICSVCGGWAYSPWIGSRKNPKPNWCKYLFCPNCGAEMEASE